MPNKDICQTVHQALVKSALSPPPHFVVNKQNEGGGAPYHFLNTPGKLDHLCQLFGNLVREYAVLVELGGDITPVLQAMAAGPDQIWSMIARQLLRDIARSTSRQFSHRAKSPYCPYCLTCFGPHHLTLPPLLSVTFYGCRSCGQSQTFFEGQATAVLDRRMAELAQQQEKTLRVNWFAKKALFDFDLVEVIRAGDEDVERFAVQVGNDTDPLRRLRYPKMRCLVAPEARLSMNTLRILRATFGQVEMHPL